MSHQRGFAKIKNWRILRRARLGPNRLTAVAAAILTLTIYT